jgi:tetratricopeptide (TPR) repeat protein
MQLRPKTHRLPLVVMVCLFVVLTAMFFRALHSTFPTGQRAAIDAGEREIAPGSSIRDNLAADAKATFSVSATAGSLLRFSIDKGDLVLSTMLYGPTGAKLLEHVSHDFEVVDLSFPAQTAGTYRIELLSHEKAERLFELKVEPLTPLTDANQRDSEARQALARAGVLRSESNEAAFRRAVEQYDQAAQIWLSRADFGNASDASLRSGDLLFDLSEYTEAFKRYQNASAFAENAGNWIAKAKALSRMGRVETYTRKNIVAQERLGKALDLFRPHESELSPTAANVFGETLSVQAEILYAKGALVKASEQFKKALKAFQGDRKGEATARLFLGYINGSMGYPEQATDDSLRALDLYRQIKNKRGEGLTLTSLGLANSFHDESNAIDLYGQAREIFHSLGDKTDEAIALNSLGQASENLHDESALTYYEAALNIFEDKGVKDAQANSLLKIAGLYFDKDLDKALAYYKRCLKLSDDMGDARTAILTRTQIARVYTAQKRYSFALAEYRRVLHFYESTEDLRGQAIALNAYGDFLLQLGEKQKAVVSFNRALSLSDTVHDKELYVEVLYYLARAHLQLGSPDYALTLIEKSLTEIEELRASVESPAFRASYFSGVQRNLKFCIEILMQLERLRPGEGFLTKAFLVSENSRARLLRELVIESQAVKRAGGSSELLQRERELRGRYRAQAQYQLELLSEGENSSEIKDLDRELAQIKIEFQEVEAKLRKQHLGLSSAEPLTLEQIQHELRDNNTMLLQFSLGDERSYLFVVTFDSIQAYELPSRKLVEDAAREFMESITAREQGQGDSNYPAKVAAADNLLLEKGWYLSRILFGPLGDRLGSRRLLIVPEGALHGLSFDALPAPVGQIDGPLTSKRLVETNEIVGEPSISTLAAIRKAPRQESSRNKLVAVIADPVLGRSDERMQNLSPSSASALAASDINPDRSLQRSPVIRTRDRAPARLVHASEEADAIVATAPWGTTMVATGFAASRETAMSSAVGQYQILHFATHGFFNSEHPELSGIMLSMVDRSGANTNGLMPLQDIYDLDISAELTVLSACQTGLGKDLKGEGLVGLTHSFLSAGSKSVVASHWKVDDRATAVFMANFYRSMFQEGLPPAAALRATKLRMMRDKQWNAPYYWAGFVLQGEWENHIDVDRYSSIRLALMLLLLLSLSTASLVNYRRRKRRFSPPRKM